MSTVLYTSLIRAQGVATMSLALGDRDLAAELKKMQDAQIFAEQLEFLPVDVAVLKTEIGRWTGDVSLIESAKEYYVQIGYKRYANMSTKLLERMKSGKVVPVDLMSGKVSVGSVVSATGAGQLAELDAAIAEARARAHAAEAAGDDDEEDEARDKMKALKKTRKKLKQQIDELLASGAGSSGVNPAKIAELEANIVDARTRAHDAEEAGDDDAEDAARKELKGYKKELKALLGVSKVKKKLEDAKKIDSEIASGKRSLVQSEMKRPRRDSPA